MRLLTRDVAREINPLANDGPSWRMCAGNLTNQFSWQIPGLEAQLTDWTPHSCPLKPSLLWRACYFTIVTFSSLICSYCFVSLWMTLRLTLLLCKCFKKIIYLDFTGLVGTKRVPTAYRDVLYINKQFCQKPHYLKGIMRTIIWRSLSAIITVNQLMTHYILINSLFARVSTNLLAEIKSTYILTALLH